MMAHVDYGWLWSFFIALVVFLLWLDTCTFTKKIARPYESYRGALFWTVFWVAVAFVFNLIMWGYLYYTHNVSVANEKALAFTAGYLIEKSLSIDNLFVFYVLFAQLNIPLQFQQRVLSLGVWSAIVLRLLFIIVLAFLITDFHWLIYVMGAFLVLTGFKMLLSHDAKDNENKLLMFLHNYLRVTPSLVGEKFFVKQAGLLYVTPLFITLILIEVSDVIFAFDSIPAIFAITTDSFIVWSSNVFAILGLRSLYFALAHLADRFALLKYALVIIIIFVGVKMLIAPWLLISVGESLSFISVTLLFFMWLSIRK
jgi:tellurite resistance protein TerC